MRWFTLVVVVASFASTADAQTLRQRRYPAGSVKLSDPAYRADGTVQPGISISERGYRLETFAGGRDYAWGYQPPVSRSQTQPRSRPVRHYRSYRSYGSGGGYGSGKPIYGGSTYGLAPAPWMFYYPGMELSPYNINSPIWGW